MPIQGAFEFLHSNSHSHVHIIVEGTFAFESETFTLAFECKLQLFESSNVSANAYQKDVHVRMFTYSCIHALQSQMQLHNFNYNNTFHMNRT